MVTRKKIMYERAKVQKSIDPSLGKIMEYVSKNGHRIIYAGYSEYLTSNIDLGKNQEIIENTLEDILKMKTIDYMDEENTFYGESDDDDEAYSKEMLVLEEPKNLFNEIKLPHTTYILKEFLIDLDEDGEYSLIVIADSTGKPFSIGSHFAQNLPDENDYSLRMVTKGAHKLVGAKQEDLRKLKYENKIAKKIAKYCGIDHNNTASLSDELDKLTTDVKTIEGKIRASFRKLNDEYGIALDIDMVQ